MSLFRGQVEGIGVAPRLTDPERTGRNVAERTLAGGRVSTTTRRRARSCTSGRACSREPGGRHRASRRAWRHAIRCAGAPGPGVLASLSGAYATGAAASAAQPGSHSHNPRCGAAHSTGRLLRHGVPPRPAARRAGLRAAATVSRGGHPALRLPWPVVRIPGVRSCARTVSDISPSGASSSRTWATAPACAPSGMAGASPARWASPPSTV